MADATGAPSPGAEIAPLSLLIEPDLQAMAKDLAAGDVAWDVGGGVSLTTGAEARARVAAGLPGKTWIGAEAFAHDQDGKTEAGIWAGIGGHF